MSMVHAHGLKLGKTFLKELGNNAEKGGTII